jgi:hypothetical protein
MQCHAADVSARLKQHTLAHYESLAFQRMEKYRTSGRIYCRNDGINGPYAFEVWMPEAARHVQQSLVGWARRLPVANSLTLGHAYVRDHRSVSRRPRALGPGGLMFNP